MRYEFRDARLYVRRTEAEREPILKRLRRVEGQVRGLQQMIEADRHCLDEMQQISAINAAMREVALIVVSGHLDAAIEFAAKEQDGGAAVADMIAVLRSALRI